MDVESTTVGTELATVDTMPAAGGAKAAKLDAEIPAVEAKLATGMPSQLQPILSQSQSMPSQLQ